MSTRAESPDKTSGLHVEILVFSGRPDPAFLITDPKEIREILGHAKGLPAHPQSAQKSAVVRSVLGYRGVRVTNLSAESREISWFDVYRADVEIRGGPAEGKPGPKKDFRADNGAGLERRLIELARVRGAINDKLVEHINSAK